MNDPVIRVRSATVYNGGRSVVFTDIAVLDCSRCGELDSIHLNSVSESVRRAAVYPLQKAARDHANAEHDGLAINVGWSW